VGLLRIGLPAAILVAGVVLVLVGGDAGVGAGIVLIGVAALVSMFNTAVRLGLASGRDRDREEAARRFFDEHGRWPPDRDADG
jgi:hypothetical protein